MDASSWSLFLICVCFKVFGTEAASWTSEMPSTVKGLSGSSVVIPCSYSYPDTSKKIIKFTGIWFHENNIIFHPEASNIQQQYRSRTSLVGDVANKNCSLKIDPLRSSDTGPFRFRIEIQGYDNFSYPERVSISVKSDPDPVHFSVKKDMKEKETVTASCSVSHSSPDSPPDFTWTHSGEKLFKTQQLVNGQWNATSTLTFALTPADHNSSLQCTVTYKGGRRQQESRTLQVKYAPMNVKVEYASDVKEGQTVGLTCSSDAHPPVHSYKWQNNNGAQLYEGNLYVVPKVSRHVGSLYCTAINEVGSAKSGAVRLNVLYAPEIKAESSCSSEGKWVKCVCIVESNPHSKVSFQLGDKILQGATRQEDGSYTIRALPADLETSEFLRCLANNTQGLAKLQLSLPPDDTSFIIFTAAGAAAAAALLIIILTAVGVSMKRRRRSAATAEARMRVKMAERAEELPRERIETYEDVPCPGIYSSDHLYANIGDDWDDQIYANV